MSKALCQAAATAERYCELREEIAEQFVPCGFAAREDRMSDRQIRRGRGAERQPCGLFAAGESEAEA